MEKPWQTSFPLPLDMDGAEVDFHEQYNEMMCLDDEEEEFLRSIMQQPAGRHYQFSQTETENNDSFSKHGSKDENDVVVVSPRAYVLSFDTHDIEPIISKQQESKKQCSSKRIRARHNAEPSKRKRIRSSEKVVDHIMAERKRRQQIAERFIALSAIIPDLKKVDKATVLDEAIKYVKQLQERVIELEKETSMLSKKKTEICGKNDDFWEVIEELPKIQVRVSEKQVLLGIHCKKQKGIEFKILNLLENIHLRVSSSSVLPFGNSTLGINIIAQMADEYRMPMNEMMKNIRQILLKSHDHEVDPY
ncbi:hypothetical protein QN277_029453 [Acacia crassicarpa]|uniref:BHLH domain-containing protein n=1 Tax=Acacia crassicarpa TaxID=499986 RepID=A0AAE1J5L8_9FABA|nr:hypothetical protein QN277_029453 [Acacia crassicarpa]